VKALQCYSCESSKDWTTCNDIKKEVTCGADENRCLKLEGTREGAGVKELVFMKMCADDKTCNEDHQICKKNPGKDEHHLY